MVDVDYESNLRMLADVYSSEGNLRLFSYGLVGVSEASPSIGSSRL